MYKNILDLKPVTIYSRRVCLDLPLLTASHSLRKIILQKKYSSERKCKIPDLGGCHRQTVILAPKDSRPRRNSRAHYLKQIALANCPVSFFSYHSVRFVSSNCSVSGVKLGPLPSGEEDGYSQSSSGRPKG